MAAPPRPPGPPLRPPAASGSTLTSPPGRGFWTVFSPVWTAYTTSFATTGGSGTCMSREIHVGINDNFSPSLDTWNAITLPCGASPSLNLKGGALFDGGPHIGTYRKRRPCTSAAVAIDPQTPRPPSISSSLPRRADWYSGVE